MADMKHFLKYPVILAQTVQKNYEDVQKKLLSGEPQHKIEALQQLWSNLCNPGDAIIGACSCDAIIALVQHVDGLLKVSDVLNTLSNLTPSAKSTQWLVRLAFQILVFQFQVGANPCDECKQLHYISPYKLRLHPHPLISMIESASQTWPQILSEVQNMFLQCCLSDVGLKESNVFEIMKPLFLYIFCNPSQDDQSFHRINSLFTVIESSNKTEMVENSCEHIVTGYQFFKTIFPHTTMKGLNLLMYTQYIAKVHQSVPRENAQCIHQQCASILTTCHDSLTQPVITSLCHLLHVSLQDLIFHSSCPCVVNVCLAHLVCQAQPHCLQSLIRSTMVLTESPFWSGPVSRHAVLSLYSLKVSLMPLLLAKDCVGFSSLKSSLYAAMRKIDNVINSLKVTEELGDLCSEVFYNLHNKHSNVWFTNIVQTLSAFRGTNSDNVMARLYVIMKVNSQSAIPLISSLLTCAMVMQSITHGQMVSEKSYKECMNVLGYIACQYPDISLNILPTILYCAKNEQDVQKQKQLLLLLPELASNPDCIAPILGTVQAMCAVPPMQPLAMKMMLQLWQRQERCFPYLQKMMLQLKAPFNVSLSNELVTMSAFAVKEMCHTEPYKNTSDLVKFISTLISKRIHPGQASLLVEALIYLIESEVVDIRTTWGTLKDTILAYSSAVVTKSTLKFLALAASLNEEISSCLQFKQDIVELIWKYVEHHNAEVTNYALVSLAHFKVDNFFIKHLPLKLRPEEPQPEKDENPEVVRAKFFAQPIPGHCFMLLVQNSSPQTQYFLRSLLSQELANFPRDVKHRAMQSLKKTTCSNAISEVPKFMLKMYERNKLPNLKSSFATGLLMTYDSQNDSNSAPKSLVSAGRNVFQLLQALLSEVTVDPKTWQNVLWLTHAWKAFMQKCFRTMVKGRQAELEMQLQQKNCDKEDIEIKHATTELWCRDKITEQLKTTSKGTPSMQGNAILALAALLCATKSQKMNKEESADLPSDSSGYLGVNHWTRMAVDTVISVVDSNYKPSGRIFSWCQYRAVSKTGRLTTSDLGKICAMHSLKLVTSVLISTNSDGIGAVLDILGKSISNKHSQSTAATNSTIKLHCSISLGGVISQLYVEKFYETCDMSIAQKLDDCIVSLTENIFTANKLSNDQDEDTDEEEEDDLGAVVAVGILLPAVLVYGNVTLKEKALSILGRLENLLESLDDKPIIYVQTVCATIGWVHVSCRNVKAREANSSVVILKNIRNIFDNKNNVVLAQCVSTLCCALSLEEESESLKLFNDFYAKWLTQTSNDRLPTRQKLTSINGLAALVGSDFIFTLCMPENMIKINNKVSKVVQILQAFIRSGKDVGMSSNSIQLLGHLYLSLQMSPTRSSSIPSSFTYLADTSILKPMFNLILEYSKKKHDSSYQDKLYAVVLPLSEAACKASAALPPVNWSSAFSPMFDDSNLGEKLQNSCFRLLLSQCRENSTASSLLTKWIQIPLFQSLHSVTKESIFRSFNVLIGNLSSNSTIPLLNHAVTVLLSGPSSFSTSILMGILSALKMNDIPEDVPGHLFDITRKIILHYPFSIEEKLALEQWTIIAECANEWKEWEKLITKEHTALASRLLFIKCWLLRKGQGPMKWCNDCINLVSSTTNKDMWSANLLILYQCFVDVSHCKADHFSLAKRIQWLQELMGDIKNSVLVTPDAFLTRVFSVAVLAWSGNTINLQEDGKLENQIESMMFCKDFLWNHSLALLPHALNKFVHKTGCDDHFTQFVIEWLVFMQQNRRDISNEDITQCIPHALLQLRQNKLFLKSSLWTNAVAALLL
ncbi:focadhesin-like [Clavelina lepadiformis]|uniref:focadhesin-like n=1 Tax=Clavelina lepadiformis TaxID=159417 RepID=UPI0040433D33